MTGLFGDEVEHGFVIAGTYSEEMDKGNAHNQGFVSDSFIIVTGYIFILLAITFFSTSFLPKFVMVSLYLVYR